MLIKNVQSCSTELLPTDMKGALDTHLTIY